MRARESKGEQRFDRGKGKGKGKVKGRRGEGVEEGKGKGGQASTEGGRVGGKQTLSAWWCAAGTTRLAGKRVMFRQTCLKVVLNNLVLPVSRQF